MNIILGILVLAFGWYIFNDVRKYDGFEGSYYKARGYGVVIMSIILGIGLIFGWVHFW